MTHAPFSIPHWMQENNRQVRRDRRISAVKTHLTKFSIVFTSAAFAAVLAVWLLG
jgi:hypothetical protein